MPMLARGGRPGLLGLAAQAAVISATSQVVAGGIARRQYEGARRREEARIGLPAAAPVAAPTPAPVAVPTPAPAAAVPGDPVAAPVTPPAALAESDAALLALLRQVNTMHTSGQLSDAEFGVYVAKFLS